MKENTRYVLDNFDYRGNIVDWIMYINHFFGEEQTDKFCEYFINAHQIIRKNDIRKIIPTHSLSVYSVMKNEQIAFVSIYSLINANCSLIQNREKGFEKVQKFYRKKDEEFSKKIKKLGYSYITVFGNWKDKNEKDTYQRDLVFAIFSEKDSKANFISNICNLLNESHKDLAFITENIIDKGPKAKIKSKIYDTSTQKVIEEYDDTSIETIEGYFSKISNTKFLFKIPYENNKTILSIQGQEKEEVSRVYYSRDKQEIIKKAHPYSFNMGMLKQALVSAFKRKNYNE